MQCKYYWVWSLAIIATVLGAQSGHPPTITSWRTTDTLPNDTVWHIGRLPNGFTYYIARVTKPAHRAELRLVVRVGSLMETDQERGVAHLIERMGFGGTTHFPGNRIADYLRSMPGGFGADISIIHQWHAMMTGADYDANAQTTFDHTSYYLPVSTDTLAHVKRALLMLDDWAQGDQFPAKDLEEERTTILGQLQSDTGLSTRVRMQQWPVLFKGSRYVDRFPMGTRESISTVSRDTLVAFYNKWYRADREAVIAVGDFDVRQMERLIREQFADLARPVTLLADPSFPIPPQPGTLISVVRDSAMSSSTVKVAYKEPGSPRFTAAAERVKLVRDLFDDLINRRLDDISQGGHAPFASASVQRTSLMSAEASAIQLKVAVNDSGMVAGVQAVVTELARVAVFGFSSDEFTRVVNQQKAGYDRLYAAASNDLASSGSLVPYSLLPDAAERHFLTHEPMLSLKDDYALDRQLRPTITRQEVDQQSAFWNRRDNRVIMVTVPDNISERPVDTVALRAIWQRIDSQVQAHTLAAYVDPTKGCSDATAGILSASAFAQHPDSLLAYGWLGEARAAAITRLTHQPTDEDAQRILGVVAFWKSQLDEAAMRLSPLVTTHPQDTLLHRTLAEVRLRQGHWADAVNLFSQAGQQGAAYAVALKAAGPQAYALSLPDSGVRLAAIGGDELLIVKLTINGHEGSFILDTGSNDLFLDSAFAAAAGVRTLAVVDAINVGNVRTHDGVGVVDSITLGGATMRHVPVGIADPATHPFDANINGLLGFQTLSQFRLTIDYPDRTITLSPRHIRHTTAPNDLVLPFWLTSHSHPLIPVTICHDTVPLLLDSGTGGLLLASTPALLARLGLTVQAVDAAQGAMQGTGGNVHADRFRFGEIQVGPISLSDVKGMAGILPSIDLDGLHFMGLISGGVFNAYRVTFDPDTLQIILSR